MPLRSRMTHEMKNGTASSVSLAMMPNIRSGNA